MNLTPEFWVAVSGVVTTLGLAGGLVLHVIKYAYTQGRTDQRINELETKVAVAGGLGTAVSALTATVDSLVSAVNRLDRTTERLEDRAHRPEMRSL